MITLSTGKLRPPSSLTAVTVSSSISMPCTIDMKDGPGRVPRKGQDEGEGEGTRRDVALLTPLTSTVAISRLAPRDMAASISFWVSSKGVTCAVPSSIGRAEALPSSQEGRVPPARPPHRTLRVGIRR